MDINECIYPQLLLLSLPLKPYPAEQSLIFKWEKNIV